MWASPAGAAVGTVTVGVAGISTHVMADAFGASAQTGLLATAITVGGPTLIALISFATFLIRRSDRYGRRAGMREDAEWEVMQRLIEEHAAENRRLRREAEEHEAELERLRRKVERLEARKTPRAAR